MISLQEGELARLFSNCRTLSLCLPRDTSGALQVRLGQLSALTGLRTLSIQSSRHHYNAKGNWSWDNGDFDWVRELNLNEVTLQHTGTAIRAYAVECAEATDQTPHSAVGLLQPSALQDL